MSMPRRRRKAPADNANAPPVASPDGRTYAARLGELIRERRITMKLLQADLALTTGVGNRFIIDLEAGKPSCHLGKALLVANAVGLRVLDVMQQSGADNPLLPDLADELPP